MHTDSWLDGSDDTEALCWEGEWRLYFLQRLWSFKQAAEVLLPRGSSRHLIFQCGVPGRRGQDQRAAHIFPRCKMKHLGDFSVQTAVNSRLFFDVFYINHILLCIWSCIITFLLPYLFHYSIHANEIFPPAVFYSVLSFAGDDALGRCWKDLQIKHFCKGFWQKLLWEVWHRSLVYIQASIIKGHNRVGGKKQFWLRGCISDVGFTFLH